MLQALMLMKFNPDQGMRVSTFFEQVVDNGIKDFLKKENLNNNRHLLADFRDNDDHRTGEPIERADAVRLATESTMAQELVGEDNIVDQLEEAHRLSDDCLSDANRALLKARLEGDDKTDEELGSEFDLSGNAYQKRNSRSLSKLRSALTETHKSGK
jgi:DNA-directed RNA polymerase specialized sigma subunit